MAEKKAERVTVRDAAKELGIDSETLRYMMQQDLERQKTVG